MTRPSNALGAVCLTALVLTVYAANYITTELGMVSVGFGLTATAGTYFAGAAFVLRDTLQDTLGLWLVLSAIILGTVGSYAVAAASIATASAVAFAVSELADLTVYTPFRNRGYVRAAVASNVVGAVVDTFLFLWIAGFPLSREGISGQVIGKLTVTALAVALVIGVRKARDALNRVEQPAG